MGGIWIYADHLTLAVQLLTPGRELADATREQISIITAEEAGTEKLLRYGVSKLYVLRSQDDLPESSVPELIGMISADKPRAVLFAGTPTGKEIAARCAAGLDAGLVTDAVKIGYVKDSFETERLVYGGLAVSTEVLSEPALISIMPNSYQAPVESEEVLYPELVSVMIDASKGIKVLGEHPVERGTVDLPAAKRIVSVGNALKKKEDIELFKELAQALGGELGCSRPIADKRWMPIDMYVGLSGVKVKPQLYLACGISGQIQHLVGMRDSKVIVAINSNESAPIFAAADYGIVGDMYEIAPSLIEILTKEA